MKKMGKYRIHFTNGDSVETSYCRLDLSINGEYLFEKDPSEYVNDIRRTYVRANINYWEPIE